MKRRGGRGRRGTFETFSILFYFLFLFVENDVLFVIRISATSTSPLTLLCPFSDRILSYRRSLRFCNRGTACSLFEREKERESLCVDVRVVVVLVEKRQLWGGCTFVVGGLRTRARVKECFVQIESRVAESFSVSKFGGCCFVFSNFEEPKLVQVQYF